MKHFLNNNVCNFLCKITKHDITLALIDADDNEHMPIIQSLKPICNACRGGGIMLFLSLNDMFKYLPSMSPILLFML